MTIKDLGRWESLEMVQRYTRSVTFQDSLKLYKAPLGDLQTQHPKSKRDIMAPSESRTLESEVSVHSEGLTVSPSLTYMQISI